MRRGALPELATKLHEEAPPKGEIVVLVAPPSANQDGPLSEANIDAKLREALRTLSVKDAASVVAGQTGQKRRKIYARAIELAAGEAGETTRKTE